MHVYHVLMSDNSVVEVYADYSEAAMRAAEIFNNDSDVFAVIAESV